MADIRLLKDHPDYAPILGFWAFREWYMDRMIDFDVVLKSYQIRINDKSAPLAMVAIEDGMPVGMVSLKENDLWSRTDINPWLASLYVLPEYRRRGIGAALMDGLVGHAGKLGYKALFLFTSIDGGDILEKFYSKRNWRHFSDGRGNYGGEVRIFRYDYK